MIVPACTAARPEAGPPSLTERPMRSPPQLWQHVCVQAGQLGLGDRDGTEAVGDHDWAQPGLQLVGAPPTHLAEHSDAENALRDALPSGCPVSGAIRPGRYR